MLEIGAVEAFLQIAQDDKATGNRLSAIETLTYLPLSAVAWSSLASVAGRLLRQLPVSDREYGHAVRVCARIPVRSVREYLGTIADEPDHPSSLTCAIELARHGDAAGLQRLLAALKGPNAEQAIEQLACLPLERLQVDRKPFTRALSAEDPIVRFWAAIALARLSEVEPLEQVWDALLSEDTQPLPIFWGNPWQPYHALTAARPLPEQLHSFLIGLYEHELKRLRQQNGLSTKLPRNANLLIGGLTGIVDVDGELPAERTKVPRQRRGRFNPTVIDAAVQRLLEKPFEPVEGKQRRILASLQPERAGKLMIDALDALEKEAQVHGIEKGPKHDVILGNAMLDIASALPEPLRLPLAELVESGGRRWPHLPWTSFAWILSRAGAEAVVTELGPRISAANAQERGQWLLWALRIVTQLHADAPFGGSGPRGGKEPLPAETVIDDAVEAEGSRGIAPGPMTAGTRGGAAERGEPGTAGRREMHVAGEKALPRGPRKPVEEKEKIRDQDPRYIQPKVKRIEKTSSVEDPPVWVGGIAHLVSVRIGPPEAGWPNPTNLMPFPYELLPAGKEHRLRVFLSEPDHMEKPLMKMLTIRRSGPSSVAEFRITPRVECRSFRARIVITHRNRILQTAILTGRVVGKPAEAGPNDRIEHEIESVVRPMLQGLEGRTRFSVAIAINHTPEGEPRLLALADKHAVVRGFTEIKDRIDAISQCLSVVANDADTYADGLHSTEGVKILRFLADNGRALYDFLVRDQLLGATLRNAPYLQIVNLTPDAYFPAEFIYDFAMPAENATLCEVALNAFDRLDFSRTCDHQDHQTPNQPVVCPFGFWGLRRVIERHACLPSGREQIAGDFVLQAEPTETRSALELAGNALLGVSTRVETEQPGATAALLSGLRTLSPIPIEIVPKWQGWTSRIESLQPSLIVTLPHAEEKSQFGVMDYFLEIGGELQKARVIGESSAHYVLARDDAPSPLVLLLGCNTAVPKTPIDSIVGHFRRGGAAIVVSTVGSVLGSHASKVAQELVEALFKEAAIKPRPLGELLRDVRRRCVGKKVLMALCIGAFGDADWQVHAAGSGGISDVPH
jgi:hypothetical protein